MHKNRLWGRVGIAAVSLVWLVSAMANGWAGYHLANAPQLGVVLAAASVAIDIMKAVALFVITAAICNRRWVAVGMAVVVFVLCAGWSLRSATDFAANILSDRMAEKNFKAEEQQMAKDLLELRKKRAEFLSRQTIDVEVTAKTKGRAIQPESDKSTRADTEFAALLQDLDKGAHDLYAAGAKTSGDPLAGLLGIEGKKLILITALSFALMLEIVSGVGFWMIDQVRLQPDVKPRRPRKAPKTILTQTPPSGPTPGRANPGLDPMAPTLGQDGFGALLSTPFHEPASNVVEFPDLAGRRPKLLRAALEDPLARYVSEPLSKRQQRDKTSTRQSRGPNPAPSSTNEKYGDAPSRVTGRGFPIPPEMAPVTAHVAAFMRECLEHAPGMSVWASELRAYYERWCQARGYEPLSIQNFGRELRRLGFRKRKSSQYLDLKLRA